ncbi:MAG: TonB-dependent receptor, partial [Acidobacteria bacterium]|nr:TonB-dependent receptor [Acidobacteriota bacterium]
DQGNTFELDPYTLLDAAVSWWVSNGIRLTLSAHNLLDEEYYWNGDTSRAESADPGAPRQVLLSASFSFR